MKFRKWLAWKMVCWARRIHDTEFDMDLDVYCDGEHAAHIGILGDAYGHGVVSISVEDPLCAVRDWDGDRVGKGELPDGVVSE